MKSFNESEVKIEKYILIRKKCKCGGEYFPNGSIICSRPVQYEHICNMCGTKDYFDECFPIRTIYEEE